MIAPTTPLDELHELVSGLVILLMLVELIVRRLLISLSSCRRLPVELLLGQSLERRDRLDWTDGDRAHRERSV